ncbi:MAG: hypothetical protein ACD_30C00112G0071 [uncultured bacterium]|uniref:Carbonic anhydrase n=4 Tax=Candidatus Daviesiibacteriota TaxID=1752718 RepID=A0A0G0EUB4_9BACT|nr:MAG: hypothetical protein ACD_30C00112G0071 [uncultured bacterium]KKQ10508.1 MAG: hypothetical protein US19_C0003G0003 [Candidatus Daviesbacteria bacterium GW2011_GWB1_36_5]KKQ14932.1 MAG: hypothetical protein US28_C0026G0010 [Candidatus Daviesbacteria bacterium GW2011_GWA1_36_8]OGE17230.1 MAG: hypothetical protein A2858_00810 [Candidatus Daviesbacteria bacterium RIFCSPHIGHO2_01_FULL_36_37]OGE36011.1 MAG: hypothetical protein A3E66_01805 [Candidatus Daviesbacteria bacterium RIFCSPHIGHO2_12_F
MSSHKAEAIIVTCIDFRLQEAINKWISENFEPKTFDRAAFGGGVKELEQILKQIKIANNLHHISKVILVNHEDCGAYGEEGTPEKHAEDLKTAKQKVNEFYPNLEVSTYFLHLDGSFEPIS